MLFADDESVKSNIHFVSGGMQNVSKTTHRTPLADLLANATKKYRLALFYRKMTLMNLGNRPERTFFFQLVLIILYPNNCFIIRLSQEFVSHQILTIRVIRDRYKIKIFILFQKKIKSI